MKMLRQIVSLALFFAFALSIILNVLFLFGRASRELSQMGLIVLIAVVFIVSLLGLILKSIRKESAYSVNIATPLKEIGGLYGTMMIVWVVVYFLTMLNR